MSVERIEEMVTAIETVVYGQGEREIESHQIGEMVMRHLRKLDQVAFVRFASVYREFTDIRDFVDELRPILAESDDRGE